VTRRWREATTERPLLGTVLALSGAVVMLTVGAATLLSALTNPTVSDVVTYTIELTAGIVVAVAAVVAFAFPREHRACGYVIASFSLISFFSRTGALCFGSMLGVFAVAALLVWSPAMARACASCGTPIRPTAHRCDRCGSWVPYPARARPADVFAVALTALFFVHIATALAAIGPYPFRRFPPVEVLPGIVAEAALLIGAVMAYRRPEENRRWGALLIGASLLAAVGPYFGFILGPLLGFAAGVTALRRRWG